MNTKPERIEEVLKKLPCPTMPGQAFINQFAQQVIGKELTIERGKWHEENYIFGRYRIADTRIDTISVDEQGNMVEGQIVGICQRIHYHDV